MRIDPWAVIAFIVDNNIKRQAMADMAEISLATLGVALKGRNISEESIYKIAKAMGVKPQEIIEEGGGQ